MISVEKPLAALAGEDYKLSNLKMLKRKKKITSCFKRSKWLWVLMAFWWRSLVCFCQWVTWFSGSCFIYLELWRLGLWLGQGGREWWVLGAIRCLWLSGTHVEHLILNCVTITPHLKGDVTLTFSYRKPDKQSRLRYTNSTKIGSRSPALRVCLRWRARHDSGVTELFLRKVNGHRHASGHAESLFLLSHTSTCTHTHTQEYHKLSQTSERQLWEKKKRAQLFTRPRSKLFLKYFGKTRT